MSARVTFCGGAGTVTGANFLLDAGDARLLIDCGALERERTCDTANLAPFPYDPKSIDALVVTHAHADHIGRIPKLVHDGFQGVIYSTAATRDLAAIMFNDALSIMAGEARRYGCEALYERSDVESALSLWQTREYHEPFTIPKATPLGSQGDASGFSIELLDAGHILGSAMVRVKRGGRNIIFTGDLGNSPEPLLNDTEVPEGANYLVMESVYGDRVHEDRGERAAVLREVIETARKRGGTLLIPSFSIERTQILLFELNDMIEKKKIAAIPVYLDAPLAIEVTEVFRKHADLLNPVARERFENGGDPFSFKDLTLTRDSDDSNAIHDAPDPKIIIAGAGMAAGGRIRSHLKRYASDPHTTILFVGYQAPGSLGRRIEDGEKKVEIDGEQVRVRAHVETLSGYSGHADRDQLIGFVEKAGDSLDRVFVTMGEPKSELFLAQRIRDFLGVDAVVPENGQSFEIDW